MTTIRKQLLVALAVIGMGSATVVAAQPPGAAGGSQAGQTAGPHAGHHAGQKMDREQRRATWLARSVARQQKLHDALALSAAQEAAWSSYSAALRPQQRSERIDRAARAAMPAPQRMELRLGMAQQRMTAMQARLAATLSLYAVLTPQQRKVFDASAMGHAGHRGHARGRQMRG